MKLRKLLSTLLLLPAIFLSTDAMAAVHGALSDLADGINDSFTVIMYEHASPGGGESDK